jgi:uncharacterized protein YigA (DUF484 family)
MNTAYGIERDTDASALLAVKEILSQHPHLLAEDAELNALARAACGNVVDLQAASIKRVERRARMIADTHRKLRAVARANLAVQAQIHACVLSLLDSATPRALDDLLDRFLAGRIGLDRAALLVEAEVPPGLMAIRRAPAGFVDAELGRTRAEALGRVTHGKVEIYGEGATDLRSQALLRLDIAGRPGLFALGSRDAHTFAESQGTELVNFLARVIERRMGAWI